jgi:hypothetical protein
LVVVIILMRLTADGGVFVLGIIVIRGWVVIGVIDVVIFVGVVFGDGLVPTTA